MTKQSHIIFITLIILLAASFIISIVFGGSYLSLNEIISGITSNEAIKKTIIWDIRIPRVLAGILIGAGLSASGCVLQGLLRNPLADPFTLGISGGAAFGIAVAAILGIGTSAHPLFAGIGALLSVFLVYSVASRKYFSVSTLVLSGVILSFLFSSLVLLIFAVSDEAKLHSTLFWLAGDLSGVEISMVKVTGVIVISGIIVLLFFSRDLDILTLGEEKATHLGVDSSRTIKIIFIIVSLIVGICVISSGIIGFVGLIIPHLIRKLTGP
ncbi:MAG: iron ABC transporter permease, partial [Elusimicrobiota bacterium]